MTIILDGDFMYPIREYHKNIPFELEDLKISNCTKGSIRTWANQYSKFTSMSLEELSKHWERVDELDKKGEELLRKVAIEWRGDKIEKYYYFSLCRDKLKLVVYQNGKEKELE